MLLLKERIGILLEQQEPCLKNQSCQIIFWAEAFNTACYTLNISIVNQAHRATHALSS